MHDFDVFNGDADGICAWHQWRLAQPTPAKTTTLVTGVKRDIALLHKVLPMARAGDRVAVFDISLDMNCPALEALLALGIHVRYFDHHGAGNVPVHEYLEADIDIRSEVCTGLIVDQVLGGEANLWRSWAIVAAFGDNFARPARALAWQLGLDAAQTHALQELGECMNYNAYGDTETDLTIAPAALARRIQAFDDPFAFIAQDPIVASLRDARRADLALAASIAPYAELPHGQIFLLPDAPWSRRVLGSWANLLAVRQPEKAHGLLAGDAQRGYRVSVRAPLATREGADRLCLRFAGGGRHAAAGIERLPAGQLPAFLAAFEETFAEDAVRGAR